MLKQDSGLIKQYTT